jgi:hypothetical protein
MTIMNPAHPDWEEFVERLGGPEGCDWQEDDTWRCGGPKYRFARAILESMPDTDVEASLAYFRDNGGGCDCTILFNIDVAPPVH